MQERDLWAHQIEAVKRMQQWVVDAEEILAGTWLPAGEMLSNEKVAARFDAWCMALAAHLKEGLSSELEQQCGAHLLQVLTNLRPQLLLCYDRETFPRTNNAMEGSIRRLKTRYRRISGRKNWNSYLLRYGRYVAFYDWWETQADGQQRLLEVSQQVDPHQWREARKEQKAAQSEQLKRFRFHHKRQDYLASLEARWAIAAETSLLP